MKIVIQRVTKGICRVDESITGEIDNGYVCFVGFAETDTSDDFDYIARKLIGIRLFENEEGKIHYSVKDKGYGILLIPQFTLYANTKKGNRPDFLAAMKPQTANKEFLNFVEKIKSTGVKVETGVFGADMKIEAHNDGPFTIIIDSIER